MRALSTRNVRTALLGSIFVLLALAGAAVPAAHTAPIDMRVEAERPAKRLVIGLDLSKSNPLIRDASFALKVSERVKGMIERLGFGSEVHVRTFGIYDVTANSFYYDTVLSVHQRPEAVADEIAKLIAATPTLVKAGKWKAQDWTNILGFLENVAPAYGCFGLPTSVVLATDGIEDSEYAHLERLNSKLPDPEGAPFKGCEELEILGLGQGQKSPKMTVRLDSEWQHWATAAGFHSFTGLHDW